MAQSKRELGFPPIASSLAWILSGPRNNVCALHEIKHQRNQADGLPHRYVRSDVIDPLL